MILFHYLELLTRRATKGAGRGPGGLRRGRGERGGGEYLKSSDSQHVLEVDRTHLFRSSGHPEPIHH